MTRILLISDPDSGILGGLDIKTCVAAKSVKSESNSTARMHLQQMVRVSGDKKSDLSFMRPQSNHSMHFWSLTAFP